MSTWRRQWHPTPVLLPGKSHGRRSLEGCSPWGHWGSGMTEWLHFHFSLSCIGEGNGNPLQYSCLENPRDWGAWWAAVYGVAQSRTGLKWLSSSSSSMSTTSQKNMGEKNLPCWDVLISDLKITHDFFQHQIIYQTGWCSMWKEDIYIQRYIISMTIFILLSILGASVESGRKVWVGLLNWANLDHNQGKVIHWVSVLHYTSWGVLKSEIVLGLNSASVIY